MSRIGKQPVELPQGVTVDVRGGEVAVNGPLGELRAPLPAGLAVQIEDGRATVTRAGEDRRTRSLHGTLRSVLANMVEGVSKGFARDLEIEGVGFRANVEGRELSMALGFASAVKLRIPEGIEIKVDGGTKMSVRGCDKQAVGDTAARIRSGFPAEPYKGKGIRYAAERVRRKVGKTVA